METTQNTAPTTGGDGNYNFTINYAGRELACTVVKNDDILDVHMDNMDAKLQIEPDGSIHQIGGNTLPESNIEFIKKEVLGHAV
jgi:hypothetical protein